MGVSVVGVLRDGREEALDVPLVAAAAHELARPRPPSRVVPLLRVPCRVPVAHGRAHPPEARQQGGGPADDGRTQLAHVDHGSDEQQQQLGQHADHGVPAL